MVSGESAAELERLKKPTDGNVGAKVGAGLAAVDRGLLGFLAGLEREADRDAVIERVMADRDADVGVAVHIGEAAGDVGDAPAGIGKRVLEVGERADVRVGAGESLFAQGLREDEASNVEVVVLGISAVGVSDEVRADRHVEREVARPLVGGAAIFGERVDAHRAGGDAARDAGVDDVDYAADRGRAEQQGRGTAQHLDPFGGQRIDRDLVVGVGRGEVERADAVNEDSHALAGKTTKDWARGGRTEARRGHAGLALQRLAEARPDIMLEHLLVDHGDAAEHVARRTADAGDDDRLIGIGVGSLGVTRRGWLGGIGVRCGFA